MKPGETTVRITLSGVKEAQLPRLKTAIKSYIQHFARETTVDDGMKKPKKGGKDAEPEVEKVPVWKRGRKRAGGSASR
jgi:hypothetical protein